MKKIILAAVMIFLFSIAISRAVEINKGLNIENVDIYPDKIAAESNFTFTANIRNVADREFYALRLTLQGGFPFSKTSPIYSLYVGTIRSNEAIPISVNLSVDKDAEAKEYPLQIVANYYVNEPSISRSYFITHNEVLASIVKIDKGVDLEIEKTVFPQKLVSDIKDAPIQVSLRNTGNKPAHEIKLTLAAQYPFIPSGKSFFIDEIKPGETKEAIFHIDVDSAASSQIYPIDLSIEWKENDLLYSTTKSFGIPVEKSSNVPEFLNTKTIILVVAGIVAIILLQVMRLRKRKK